MRAFLAARENTLRVRADAEALASELTARGAGRPVLALVLGSGLGALIDRIQDARRIPAVELEHLPWSRVAGHAGEIVVGALGGVAVIVQSGRVHLYEGRSPFEVTRAVRAFALLGVRALVLTNAAGGLVPEWEPGTLVRIVDHLNLQWRSPLHLGEDARRTPYDDELGELVHDAARGVRVPLERGTYAGLLGPSYETPAEIGALRSLGAHTVGMSTVGEACAGAAAGMRVVGVSVIANPAAGLGTETLRHEDVLATVRRSAQKLALVLERAAVPWKSVLGA